MLQLNFRNKTSFEFLFNFYFSHLYIVNLLRKIFEHIFLFFWRHEIKRSLGWRKTSKIADFKTSYDAIMLLLSRGTSSGRLSSYDKTVSRSILQTETWRGKGGVREWRGGGAGGFVNPPFYCWGVRTRVAFLAHAWKRKLKLHQKHFGRDSSYIK